MAIAFDASSTGKSGGTGSASWSHTTTGSNVVLVAGVLVNSINAPSSATYNTVAMSLVCGPVQRGTSGYYLTLFALAVGTGIGAATIAIANPGTDMYTLAESYTGCNQTGLPDSSATHDETTLSTCTVTTTTIADNSWLSGISYDTAGSSLTAGSNTILRQNNGFGGVQMWDSNAAQTPGGSHSLNFVVGAGSGIVGAIISLAPLAASDTLHSQITM